MLAAREHRLPEAEADQDDVFCLGVKEEEGGSLGQLAGLAAGVLAGLVEGVVESPQEAGALGTLAAYLHELNSRLLTAVMTAVLTSRPRWLPLEYHWAPLDHDPLLELLQLVGERLTSLTYTCHPLSREPLLQALAAMPALTSLVLPETADDNTLAVVGGGCPALATLCVRGSKAVTDDGVRRLLLRRHTYTRSRWRRLFSRWQALRASLSRQQSRYRQLPPAALGDQALLPPLDPDHLNPLSATLMHLDLSGTRVSAQAAEWARGVLVPQAFVDVTRGQPRSLCSQTSLEDQMVGLLAPLTP